MLQLCKIHRAKSLGYEFHQGWSHHSSPCLHHKPGEVEDALDKQGISERSLALESGPGDFGIHAHPG